MKLKNYKPLDTDKILKQLHNGKVVSERTVEPSLSQIPLKKHLKFAIRLSERIFDGYLTSPMYLMLDLMRGNLSISIVKRMALPENSLI